MECRNIGDFTLIKSLGKGGMGEVHEATANDGSRVALKIFTNEGEHAEFLRKRFLAEGKLLARLDHPRLVKVRRLDIDNGRPYFTMDFVCSPKGVPQTLEDLRHEHSLDEARIAAIYADLRDGLAYLHAQGVAHRDIKLENVLIDANGRAVLSDFGISRIFDKKLKHELAVTTTMTGDGAPIMGSFGYLAPELKRGESATPASDAYALGVLVFRLLTGVWYEADSTAKDLLAGFDIAWTKLLEQLLNEDAAKRLPMPEKVALAKRHRLGKRWAWIFGAVMVIAVWVFGYVWMRPTQYSFEEFFQEEMP